MFKISVNLCTQVLLEYFSGKQPASGIVACMDGPSLLNFFGSGSATATALLTGTDSGSLLSDKDQHSQSMLGSGKQSSGGDATNLFDTLDSLSEACLSSELVCDMQGRGEVAQTYPAESTCLSFPNKPPYPHLAL